MAAAALVGVLLRAFPFLAHAYPTGADYGHYSFYAQLYLDHGWLPRAYPYYQLGLTEWTVLPGGALVYALLGALSGRAAIDLAPVTPLFAVLDVTGAYLLARRAFGPGAPALMAAAVAAVFPTGADMAGWSAYGNLLALGLLPFALLAFRDYWAEPSPRRLLVAAVVVTGVASVHHLTTVVLGLVLVAFLGLELALTPAAALRKAVPLAGLGLVLGLPLLPILLRVSRSLSGNLAPAVDPFLDWRVDWVAFLRLATPLSLVLLGGGTLALLRHRAAARVDRLLAGCYLAVVLALCFAWVVGLRLLYVRALYYLPLAAALGGAALLCHFRQGAWRRLVAGATVVALGTVALEDGRRTAAYFEIVTPDLREGLLWLRAHSAPGDVVATSALLAFHAPPLLQRPTMVALRPDLVANPAERPVARDAYAVLAGLPDADAVMARRRVRFVVLSAHEGDWPAPGLSRAVMAGHPRARLLFSNPALAVYGVELPPG